MNLDKSIETLEAGFQNPDISIRKVEIQDGDMGRYGLRRKKAGLPSHRVWMIMVGETGAPNPSYFFDHSLNKAFKKALTWKAGTPAPAPAPSV
jgi:hypothetical protein